MPECAYHRNYDGEGSSASACSSATTGYRCTTPSGAAGVPYRTYFSRDGVTWVRTGSVCLGDNETPVSLDAVLAQIRAFADQLVPPTGQLQVQPPGGVTLVNLPTLMYTNTPPVVTKTFFATAGSPVRVGVTVRPTVWRWQVDSIVVLTTDFPGRAYSLTRSPRLEPNYYAAHTFDSLGAYRLSVTVDWLATAAIPGLGTMDIDGTISKPSAQVALQVKEARAQLESSAGQ